MRISNLLVAVLLMASLHSVGQNITPSYISTGLSGTTQLAGTGNVAIFGIQLDKAGGGTSSITSINVDLTQDPTATFTNVRLVRSDNNSQYDVPDLANVVSTGTLSASSITFDESPGTITTFNGASGGASRVYFVVVDVLITTPTTTITPSLTEADVVAGSTVVAATLSGSAYTFETETLTVGSLNSIAANKVAASPLIASSTDQAIFGFSLASNSTQVVSEVTLDVTSPAVGKLSSFSLIRSTDADFSTTGDNTTVGTAVFDASSGTTIAISGLSESITFGRNYFISTNVDGSVTGATANIQLSLDAADIVIDGGSKNGSASGIDYSFAALVTDINQITGGIAVSPLGSGATEQAILGFSISSNGNSLMTALDILLTSNPTGFTSAKLYSSANNTFGGDAEIVDPSGYTATLNADRISFSGLAQSLSSTVKYYFIVVDIATSANASLPTIQPSFTSAEVSLSGGSITVTPTPLIGSTYSFIDSTPPNGTYSTVGSSPNVSVLGNITLTYDEPIRKADGTPLIDGDLVPPLLTLNETNAGGAAVTFTATITSTATSSTIVINPSATLKGNQVYYVSMSAVEDFAANDAAAETTTFTTEPPPGFANNAFAPLATCIGDNITVTGTNFGVAVPTVVVNGVTAVITANTNTSITFTAGPGMAGSNLSVQITNNSNTLSKTVTTTLIVHPAIDQTLAVTPIQGGQITPNPAQNTSVNLTIDNSQSGFTYTYFLISQAAGYGKTLPFNLGTDSGTGGTILESTTSLTKLGSYQYRVDVSRTGCTTKSLNSQPVLTVQELGLTVSATDTDLCDDETVTLIGSASGGTGFYQFEWTSVPAGYASSTSSPSVNPPDNIASITYNLKVTDNEGNIKTGSVAITLNDVPTAAFAPAPTETSVRTKYVIEPKSYQLYGSPAGGVFSGQGVAGFGGIYFFNPSAAGVGTWPITYTYTAPSGCAASTSLDFEVTTTYVNGLDPFYCFNAGTDTGLSPTPNAVGVGYQFYEFRFFSNGYYNGTALDPLTVTSQQTVNDIQTGLPVQIPAEYSLNVPKMVADFPNITTDGFYIVVFVKDASGGIFLRSFQFAEVKALGPKPAITGIPKAEICSNSTPFDFDSSIPEYVITAFSIDESEYSGALSTSKNKRFTPNHSSLMSSGVDSTTIHVNLIYKDNNNCSNDTEASFLWVKRPNPPIVADSAYCQKQAGPFMLKARANGSVDNVLWYDENPDVDPNAEVVSKEGFLFRVPGIDGQTAVTEKYYATQVFRGCQGPSASADITIKPAPDASFTTPAICQNRNFTLTGPLDATNGNTPYKTYEWFFGDRGTATGRTVSYKYENLNQYDIVLFVTSIEDCVNSTSRSITVGENPKPNFIFNSVCEGDQTQFIASSNLVVQKYSWEFGDTKVITAGNINDAVPSPDQGTYKEPRHQFPLTPADDVRDFQVLLRSYTATGCYDSIFKQVTIVPYLKQFNTANPYLLSNLEAEKGFWSVQNTKIPANSSWEFATPSKTIINSSTTSWVTKATGDYNNADVSYLNGPCFDITGFLKPAISFDYIAVLEKGYDGVNLEYTVDGGVNWIALGTTQTGNNWYNTQGFSSNIGSSQVGWSDTLRGPGNSWLEAKHKLDGLPNKAKIQFRIAFGSNDSKSFEGFAFNNLKIEDRNRTMLVENFTNIMDADYVADRNEYNSLVPALEIETNEFVRMQYHLGYPGPDPIFDVNTADPTARAAYYGISNTQGLVPRTYIDGVSGGNLLGTWHDVRKEKRALDTSPIKLSIETVALEGHIHAKLVIDPVEDIPLPGQSTPNLVAHLAVVERSIGSDLFVVRKLIPSAIGTPIILPLTVGTTQTVEPGAWLIDITGMNLTNLSLIGFVQDVNTKEVYQTTILLNPTNIPSTVTGVEALEVETLSLYPNPANHEIHVEMTQPATEDINLKLIDVSGRSLRESVLTRGQRYYTINATELPGGVYILQLQNSKGIARKKVMIVHK
jgi:hypothetical protein